MTDTYIRTLLEKLPVWGVRLAPGLTCEEVAWVERRYGFCFPPDLRRFLQVALPVSEPWVDWRGGSEEAIRERAPQ